jgi:hypothetical protein
MQVEDQIDYSIIETNGGSRDDLPEPRVEYNLHATQLSTVHSAMTFSSNTKFDDVAAAEATVPSIL